MQFNCLTPTVVFQEVPNEISLCFSITGCKIGCSGCHSTELWDENKGKPLCNKRFKQLLKRYQGLITCVLFLGGEWHANALIEKLIIAKHFALKTCLYSGLDHISTNISNHLTYLKTGAWNASLGGLESKNTNQIFRNMLTGENLNHLFIKPDQRPPNHNTNENTQGANNNVAA
jgi:anaerobic ribonucleoside-triphosphate reductase activating protein